VRRQDHVVALALVAGGLLAILVVIPRYVDGGAVGDGLSPAFMPYVAAGIATLAALAMLFERPREREVSEEGSARLTRANVAFLCAAAAVLAASYALMSSFGYVIGGVVLMAGLLKLAHVKTVPLAIAAVAAPAVLWLLFVELLAMPLP